MPDIAVSPDEFRARAEALVPVLRERAPDAEALRRLPDETVRDLVAAGFIRATLPSRLGGTEIDYRSVMELVAILAHGCASTAASAMPSTAAPTQVKNIENNGSR